MKNVVAVLLLALSSNVALAGEVGAPNPQLAGSAPSIWEVAIAETGTSISWAEVPFSSNKANAHQMAEVKSQIDSINQSMNTALKAALEDKLLRSLEF